MSPGRDGAERTALGGPDTSAGPGADAGQAAAAKPLPSGLAARLRAAMRQSIAFRLLAISALWIGGALYASGWVLGALFEHHVDQTYVRQLDNQLVSLAASLEWDPAGNLLLTRAPADPRFERPYSGAYWQASGQATGQTTGQTTGQATAQTTGQARGQAGAPVRGGIASAVQSGAQLRSRSLWDTDMPATVERELASGEADIRTGPNGQSLLVRTRRFDLPGSARPVDIAVALDRGELRLAKRSFRRLLWLSLAALGGGLMLAAWAQVRFGLAPLKQLREAIARLQARRDSRLGGDWPLEVVPLVNELNALLRKNLEAVERSRRQAADLAHAVKTPLAILANDTGRLAQPEADRLRDQVESMRRHVDRHLARARAAGAGGVTGGAVAVRPVVDTLARALARLHAGRDISIAIEGDGWFDGDRLDLTEILGNLLDNACQWAQAHVRVTLSRTDEHLAIRVEDDGPGMPADARALATTRFGRLDEAGPGSGLGLAIVADLCALYGGTLTLDASPMGGLAVRLAFRGVQAL